MRRGILLCLVVLILGGCSAGPSYVPPPQPDSAVSSPSAETSLGAELPPDDPSIERGDEAGQSPDESVLALVDALNRSDWKKAYSSFATPSADYSIAAREWAEATESYSDFRVLETRVVDSDAAWVRVVYEVSTDPLSSAMPPVVVVEPGEWWPLHKIDGYWKTQWMPRQ